MSKKSSYKHSRSRKVWDIDTLQLRMQDAMKAIEPAFLGEEGEDYTKEEVEFYAKISHAYSQLGAKIRQAIKVRKMEEIEERLEILEQELESNQ